MVLPAPTANCNQLLVDAMIRSFVCHLLMGLKSDGGGGGVGVIV